MEVVGYPNYLIYPDGRVQNKKSKRYLSQCEDNNGYYCINLCKDGKPKSYRVHRLIAEHYISNPDNKPCVDHINRDTKDNRLENLRWATKSENGENRCVPKNNGLGIKNISYIKREDRYSYTKIINGIKHYKSFKTLEEAIAYKEEYELQFKK